MPAKRAHIGSACQTSSKRSRTDACSAGHSWDGACDVDLSSRVDHFLRQIGVCLGVHAAADDNIRAKYGLAESMTLYSAWQGVSEQAWCATPLQVFKRQVAVMKSHHCTTREVTRRFSSLSSVCRQCCAELNALLHACKHRIREIPLESYEAWSRASKAAAFAKFQQHYSQQQQPKALLQMQMVSHLMNSMLCEQPEVAICRCTLNLQHACPDWLRAWCSRWGCTTGLLTVICIEAYPERLALPGFDSAGDPVRTCKPSQYLVRTVYMPGIC